MNSRRMVNGGSVMPERLTVNVIEVGEENG